METKKTNQKSIENNRSSLLLMGLSVAGALTLMSFEYRTFDIDYTLQPKIACTLTVNDDPLIEIQIEKPATPVVIKPMPIKQIASSAAVPNTELIVSSTAPEDPSPVLADPGVYVASLFDFGSKETEIDTSTYVFVSNPPTFPGGNSAFVKYLQNNISYPQIAIENKKEGKVYVSFVVEKDGSISDVAIAKGVNKYLDAEAVRVMEAMPRWIPGRQANKDVRVRLTQPVSFVLSN